MQKDLYNRLLEFELDNDIFDTSEYDRTIEHVKEELKTPKDIKQYINYYNLVLVDEEGSDDELCQKLEGFIDELSNLLSEKEKQFKNKNNFKTNIIAAEDTDIIIINNKTLKDIIKDNIHVRCFVYELMNNKMSMILTLMQNMPFNDLTKRLSDFLMEIYERDNDTEIKITQEEIAKNIGSSREGVSRMLKKFEKENLIVLSRKKIILKNINKLKNI